MSDEEDDYMSDKFLSGAADVRPSLVQNRSIKRQLEVETRKVDLTKRQKQERDTRLGLNRNEILQESLKKPIGEANKGFQLLAKMGYKPGQALGRQAHSNSHLDKDSSVSKAQPLLEPIGITIKSDRGGFGREAALKELAQKRKELRAQHLQAQAGVTSCTSTAEFRARATQKAEERFLTGALKRCQCTCENLDMDNNVTEPEIKWFWPERTEATALEEEAEEAQGNKSEDEDDAEEDEYSLAEKVELLTNYMRTSYRFCFWCGTQYESQDDLDANCPGLTKDDH